MQTQLKPSTPKPLTPKPLNPKPYLARWIPGVPPNLPPWTYRVNREPFTLNPPSFRAPAVPLKSATKMTTRRTRLCEGKKLGS